eukprot:780545-Prorocentrum_lima.AAC.1
MSVANVMIAFTAPTFCRIWSQVVKYGGMLRGKSWAAALTVEWARDRWRGPHRRAGFGTPGPWPTERGVGAVNLRSVTGLSLDSLTWTVAARVTLTSQRTCPAWQRSTQRSAPGHATAELG